MSKSHSLRIVIADDDPQLRSCLRTQLTNLGYMVVAEATDGREAVSFARQLHPDLIVMGVKMPNVDGLAASRQIDLEGTCPVVLLSAFSNARLVREACALSAIQCYLVKSVTEEDLGIVSHRRLAGRDRFTLLSKR